MAALHQHVPRALAFCAVTESPEAVKERITTFLTMPPGKAYCTECLAEEARLPLERVREALVGLAPPVRLHRRFGRCSRRIHGTCRKVTSAAWTA